MAAKVSTVEIMCRHLPNVHLEASCERFTLLNLLWQDELSLRDIGTCLLKSVMFCITITAVGCYEGFSTGGGAEEIGRSTTRAVVISIFLVIVVDLIFTALFFFAAGQ